MRNLPKHLTTAAIAGAFIAPASAAASPTISFRFPSYTPPNVTIVRGDSVTWTADPGHDFLAFPGPTHHPLEFFDSSIAPQHSGTTTTRTFNTLGTYQYYCALHWSLGMLGTVNVVEPPAGSQSAASAPAPAPAQPAPAATDSSAPDATITLPQRVSLKSVRRYGLYSRLRVSKAAQATASLWLGELKVGNGSTRFGQAGEQILAVKLTKGGRHDLKQLVRARLRLVVDLRDAADRRRSVARSFTTTR
jgi:plastocyanin